MKIVRAFKPGDVIFIETARPMTAEAMANVTAQFKRLCPEMKVVVLQEGLRVAGSTEADPLVSLIERWRSMLEDGIAGPDGAFRVATEMVQILKGGEG